MRPKGLSAAAGLAAFLGGCQDYQFNPVGHCIVQPGQTQITLANLSTADVLFVIDPVEEELAVAEARRLKIPIVAVCDTDCNPDLTDHPIPGNDDAARAIKLFCGIIADAVLEGKAALEAAKNAATMAEAEKKMLEADAAAQAPAASEEMSEEGSPQAAP